jgi:hypothetical protein
MCQLLNLVICYIFFCMLFPRIVPLLTFIIFQISYKIFYVFLFLAVFSFRLGRMYRYSLDKTDAASLSAFVTSFYKNYPAESIPVPKTPL